MKFSKFQIEFRSGQDLNPIEELMEILMCYDSLQLRIRKKDVVKPAIVDEVPQKDI